MAHNGSEIAWAEAGDLDLAEARCVDIPRVVVVVASVLERLHDVTPRLQLPLDQTLDSTLASEACEVRGRNLDPLLVVQDLEVSLELGRGRGGDVAQLPTLRSIGHLECVCKFEFLGD
jgi:hypothetical protein